MTEYPFVTFICAFYEENLSQSFVTWDSIRFGSKDHDNVISLYHSYSDFYLAQTLLAHQHRKLAVEQTWLTKSRNSLPQALSGSISPRRT